MWLQLAIGQPDKRPLKHAKQLRHSLNISMLANCSIKSRTRNRWTTFCAKMQHLAKQIGADKQMLRFAVLNGLRPDI